MFWALLLIAGTIALVKWPRFRKAVFVIAAVLVLAVCGSLMYNNQQTNASKKLVRVEQLSFTDMRLGPESFGSSYKLTGRVKNNSGYTVVGIQTKLQVLDCDDNSKCDVVGEEEQHLLPVIPAGQVRDIDESVYFGGGTRVRGRLQWNYRVTEISARY